MSKWNVFGKVSGTVAKVGGKALLKCRAGSPKLLLAGGIVIGVAAIVTACVATRKLDEATEEIHKELDDIQTEEEDLVEKIEAEELSEQEAKELRKGFRKRKLRTMFHGVLRFLRLYALPAGLTVLAIFMVLRSHNIMNQRYLGAVAAYTALDGSFKDYRRRIRDIAGEEAEARLYNGTEDVEVIENLGRDNEEKKTVQKRKEGLSKVDSPYEFDFNCETAPQCASTNSEHNFTFLYQIQCWANDLLNARGYVFLNEILNEIGIKPTPAGQLVGWMKKGDGDGYIDFGCVEYYNDEMSDALNGKPLNIHLNFNCDGIVYNRI